MANQAQWTAKWCWSGKHDARPWNHYVYFRKVVDLTTAPRRAVIRVSADARYTLYVNARRIHYGPARSFQQWQSFDTLDLSQFLIAGRNTICAIVHQFGVPTFQSVFRDTSGFLLNGVIEQDAGKPIELHTPGDWLCRHAKAWRRDVDRMSVQLGFQEHFDVGEDQADWMSPTFEATQADGWNPPYTVGPVGCHPWLNMEERGVPPLADRVESFAKVVAQFTGEMARGSRVSDNVHHLTLREERQLKKDLFEQPLAMLRDDDSVTTVTPPPDGSFTAVVLDLGQYRSGHFMLDIAEAAGNEDIDVIYSEEIEKDRFPRLIPEGGDGSAPATASRYRCRAGAQRWETFHFVGMKHVALIFRHVEKPLKIRHVAVRQVQAGVDDIGRFECSDKRLTEIWNVGRETQRNCLFDAFVDCPWREQAMWWGDARVQAKVTSYAFGDNSILERGIRLVARSQAPDGALHAHPPADLQNHRLPDFMLTWVSSIVDYYEQCGKTELLRECLPTMHRVFDFMAGHEVKDGLIGNFDGFWLFLDWQKLFKQDVSATLNLLYLQALRHAKQICELVDEPSDAQRYGAAAERTVRSIEQYFWNDKTKRWRDGFDLAADKPVDVVSQHANALAILLNLKPDTHEKIAREVLLKSARARKSDILTGSPFFYAHILEAMIKSGLRQEAIDLIRDKWGKMIDGGATTFWELWEITNESRCHAWSASPVYHLSQQILGVTPVEPGWTRIRIAPCPGKLEFARGVVPSPQGPIRVEWEKVGDDQLAVRVDLPPGVSGQFISPLGQTQELRPGGQEFHT